VVKRNQKDLKAITIHGNENRDLARHGKSRGNLPMQGMSLFLEKRYELPLGLTKRHLSILSLYALEGKGPRRRLHKALRGICNEKEMR
jgi:hypothetical protein